MVKLLAKLEKPTSITINHLNLTKKLWKVKFPLNFFKMQFINMAIVPFLISASMLNFFNLGGLIEEMNLIFLLNTVVPNIMGIFVDVPYFTKLVQRWFLDRFLQKDKGGPYTQLLANEIVCNPDFEMSEPYAYIFSTVASAMFYLTIFPMGIIYAIVSLILHFFVQKVRRFFLTV